MITCPACEANISPLDGGQGGRHDSDCWLLGDLAPEVEE